MNIKVAEYGEEKEIVGVIRGCVKTVTTGGSNFVKLAYLLGLRVSPTHRLFFIFRRILHIVWLFIFNNYLFRTVTACIDSRDKRGNN